MRNLGRTGVLIDKLYCGSNIEPFCFDVCRDHRRPQSLAEICSGSNIEPFCSDVCRDHRRPQSLAEICRNMGICCGFRWVAARGKYPGFILF